MLKNRIKEVHLNDEEKNNTMKQKVVGFVRKEDLKMEIKNMHNSASFLSRLCKEDN